MGRGRFLEPPHQKEGHAQPEVCVNLVRIDVDRLAEIGDGADPIEVIVAADAGPTDPP